MAPKIREISAELQEAAKRNLHEVPERIEADLAALKTWIDQQPHLNPRTDDQFLIAFLRGCKYSLEKTKSKLDKYYTLRTKYPELFNVTDVNDPKFREIHRLGWVFSTRSMRRSRNNLQLILNTQANSLPTQPIWGGTSGYF